MPMLPHKRSGGRRGGSSRHRRGDDDGASLIEPSDGCSTNSGDDGASPSGSADEPFVTRPAYESKYHEIVASRLAQLELPAGADNDGSLPGDLPSREILELLTRKSFHDQDSRAALLEYQCHKFLSETQEGLDRDSGESDSANVDMDVDSGESASTVVAMDSTYTEPDDDVITEEEHMEDCELLGSRMTDIDTYTELDQEQTNQLHLKRALYRIRAALLLKGKPVHELNLAALERKYPPELIVENKYFFHYVHDGYFGWYFDSNLCYKEFLTDYQRLVIFNDGGDEYQSWSKYRAFYSTPEADRDYLLYWETIVKKIKWLDQHVLMKESSIEYARIRTKALFQAIRIAAGFPNMTLELAAYGFHEYIWITRIYLMFVKDLHGVFFEIWKRTNVDRQLRFRDALQQVYDEKLFPAHDRSMKYALEHGDSNMDQEFLKCTTGISDSVTDDRARELIAQEVHWRRGAKGTYERYARKKLKIAELIGLISKDEIAAA